MLLLQNEKEIPTDAFVFHYYIYGIVVSTYKSVVSDEGEQFWKQNNYENKSYYVARKKNFINKYTKGNLVSSLMQSITLL